MQLLTQILTRTLRMKCMKIIRIDYKDSIFVDFNPDICNFE